MSDIRGYSTIAEHADPSQLAQQLNRHRAEMNRAILAAGGTVMQYVGDAVMAVFGAPEPCADHADRALVAAARDARRPAAGQRASGQTSGLPPFGLGIGLSTGDVAAALLGSDERVEYTRRRRRRQPVPAAAAVRRRGQTVLSEADLGPALGEAGGRGSRHPARQGPRHPGRARASIASSRPRRSHDHRRRQPCSTDAGRAARDLVVECGRCTARSSRTRRRCGPCAAPTSTSARGEFVAVMGPSGCGKSTLLNIIAGLDVPDEGEVIVAGESLVGKRRERAGDDAPQPRRHRVPVLQPARGHDRARERGDAGADRRHEAQGRRDPARDLLDLLGIGDKAKQAPGALSGGQRQRLAIARALANEPTLVLADEPTGALDSEGGEEVLELFRRLHTGGQTILLVTHDQPVADAAQRIVRMKDGRVVDDGRGERHRRPRIER